MKISVKRFKAILFALMYIAIYFAVSIGLEFIYLMQKTSGGYNISEIEKSLTNGSFALSVIAAIISAWIYLLIIKVRKIPIKKAVNNEKITPMVSIMVICLAFGARLCVTAYYHFSQNIELLKKSIDDAAAITPTLTSVSELFVALFAVSLAAPLFEEFLFRALVYGELKKVMRAWAANSFQALAFSIAHAVLFQSLFAFFMGVILGIVYEKTKSLKASVICHGAFNISVIFTGSSLNNVSAAILMIFGVLLTISALGYIVFTEKR